ncbi:MAG: hypothetical protein ABI723_05755 [Bacteroidia bacterium]
MSTKLNYRAWDIDISQFPENGNINDQLLFLLKFVMLAPSGHNSQPWLLSVKENSVDFSLEKSRSLEESDPTGRQLMISFGCALENFLIAAKHFGFDTEVTYSPKDSVSNIIVSVICNRINSTDNDNLVEAVLQRHTDRGAYKDLSIDPVFVNEVLNLSSDELKFFIVSDHQQKEKLVSIVSEAQVKIMDSDAFRNELSGFVKSSYTDSKNGIPGFALGLPAPVSLLAPWLVKKMNLARKTQKQDDATLRKTPAYMIIAGKNDDKFSWLKAGQFFEHAWLMACKDKMVCSPMAAVIQDKTCRKNLQQLLNTDLLPHVFFRIGFPEKESRPTPRYLVEDLLLVKK